jgi:uncharacterized protein
MSPRPDRRRRALWLLLALGLLSPARVQAQAATCPASDPPLWEVIGGRSPLYLLGSVHALRPDAYPLGPRLEAIFASSEVVAFELDLGEMERRAMEMFDRGIFQNGETLDAGLPAGTVEAVAERLTGLGVPPAMVPAFKPWMAGLLLSNAAARQAGFDPEWGLDLHFHQRALAAGKTILPLETTLDQIAVFEGLSPAAQRSYLLGILETYDRALPRMEAMTQAWRTGDEDTLARMVQESLQQTPELKERILHQRNRKWIEPLEALLASDRPALVLVGTGHLVGEGSVLDLLEQRGHRVERRREGCSGEVATQPTLVPLRDSGEIATRREASDASLPFR